MSPLASRSTPAGAMDSRARPSARKLLESIPKALLLCRGTDSLCPGCVVEVRDAIVAGIRDIEELLIGGTGEIPARIVEEDGRVLIRKECDKHGAYEDVLSIDPKLSQVLEGRFFGRDFRTAEDAHVQLGGMWFQDLWTYDFRRTEMCVIPYATQEGEISFCAYNSTCTPFRSDKGSVQVRSDISENFSRDHADHADNVWRFFSRVFARSPGRRIELYYTENVSLYQRVFAFCPSTAIPGGRQVTTCFDESERFYRWFIVPFQIPDFATQLHEIGHSFLFFTYEAF